MNKKWYKSRTIWFNLATALVIASAEIAPLLDVVAPETQVELRTYVILASVIGNLILRFLTESRVEM